MGFVETLFLLTLFGLQQGLISIFDGIPAGPGFGQAIDARALRDRASEAILVQLFI